MDKHAEIIVYGRVQKAGFRDFIDEIAFHFNLNGYVKNLNDGTVQIICEGEENSIKELLEKINISQYPIRVENIDIREMNSDISQKIDGLGNNLGDKIDGLGDNLGDKIDGLGNNLGDKIDGLGNNLGDKIDGLGDNLSGKIDGLGDKIDQNRIEITSEICSTRDDFRSHIDERISVIEHDLAQIKARIMI